MASINGVEIKNVRYSKDHMGYTMAQGTVYLNGKKLGGWSQDPWGGSGLYEFDKTLLTRATDQYRYSGVIDEGLEPLFNEDDLLAIIVGLKDDETKYKKGIKKGYNAYIVCDNYTEAHAYYDNGTREEILNSSKFKDFVERHCLNAEDSVLPSRVSIYTDIKDFVI